MAHTLSLPPEAERHNICEAKSFKSDGSLVLSSPSFSGNAASAAQSQFLSCECEVSRGDSEAVALPWLRTRLDTGEDGACGEEMLLIDSWEDDVNRYSLAFLRFYHHLLLLQFSFSFISREPPRWPSG